MRPESKFQGMANTLIRVALWFCACNALAAALTAQCSNPYQIPTETYSSGSYAWEAPTQALSASNFTVNGTAQITLLSGTCIQLLPGFHALGTSGARFIAQIDGPPSNVSVSPSSGTGTSQQFTWTVSSPAGYSNLSFVQMLFNSSNSWGSGGCSIEYNVASNVLAVAYGSNWSSWIVPGSSSNTGSVDPYCTVNGIGSSVSTSGTLLAITVSVTFQPSFAGTWNNYMVAGDNEGFNSSWQQMGTWTVPGASQYTLTTSVSPSGGGTISPSCPTGCSYSSGSQVTLTATPASGYRFSGFSGSVGSSSNPLTVTLNSSMSVTANFTPVLTTTVSPSGDGTVSPSCPSGCSYSSGSQVTITATPVSGYQFSGFTGTVNSSSNPLTVTVTSGTTETANFTPVATNYQLTTSVSPSGEGTVSPSCPSGCSYSSGTPVTITATPASGYQFSGFTGTVNSTSNPLTVTMNSAMTETANFVPNGTNYQLTTTVSPSGDGTVSPSCPSGCSYSSGTQVTITATGMPGRS